MEVVLATRTASGNVVVATRLGQRYDTEKIRGVSLVVAVIMQCIAVAKTGTCSGCSCCCCSHGVATDPSAVKELSTEVSLKCKPEHFHEKKNVISKWIIHEKDNVFSFFLLKKLGNG